MTVVESGLTDNTEGGNDLRSEGTFHFIVTKCEHNPTVNDKVREALRFNVGVLDGTTKDAAGKCIHAGKEAVFDFWHPTLTQKNQGEHSRKRQTRMLHILGIASESDLGKEGFTWDTDEAGGRQFIAKVVLEPWVSKTDPTKKGENVAIQYFDFWHVDDPIVASIPKDESYLETLPAKCRLTAAEKAKEAVQKSAPGDYSEPMEPVAAKKAEPDFSSL